MQKNEIIEKVRELLFSKPVESKFIDAVLKDGTKVKVDGDLVLGSSVMVVDVDGNEIPAPDAEHTLEDGTVVTTVGGVITEIEAVEEVTEEEEVVTEELVEEEVAVEEVVEEPVDQLKLMEERMTELEKKMEEILSTSSMTKTEMGKITDATIYLAEEFSKTPAGEKLEIKKSGFLSDLTESKTNTKSEKMNQIQRILRG